MVTIGLREVVQGDRGGSHVLLGKYPLFIVSTIYMYLLLGLIRGSGFNSSRLGRRRLQNYEDLDAPVDLY